MKWFEAVRAMIRTGNEIVVRGMKEVLQKSVNTFKFLAPKELTLKAKSIDLKNVFKQIDRYIPRLKYSPTIFIGPIMMVNALEFFDTNT